MENLEVGKKKKKNQQPRVFHGVYSKENTTNKWLRTDQEVGLGEAEIMLLWACIEKRIT